LYDFRDKTIGRKAKLFLYPLHSTPALGVPVVILPKGSVWKKIELRG